MTLTSSRRVSPRRAGCAPPPSIMRTRPPALQCRVAVLATACGRGQAARRTSCRALAPSARLDTSAGGAHTAGGASLAQWHAATAGARRRTRPAGSHAAHAVFCRSAPRPRPMQAGQARPAVAARPRRRTASASLTVAVAVARGGCLCRAQPPSVLSVAHYATAAVLGAGPESFAPRALCACVRCTRARARVCVLGRTA